MSIAKINHDTAKTLLSESVAEIANAALAYKPQSKHSKDIAAVILGSHLTYRYVLFTGLLAKATHAAANPIALQAGAPIKGAYDARSLCHKVIVPMEAALFDNRLGGSNEPYLNKPARFTHLSEDNAVRRGQDMETLKTAIRVLTGLAGKKDALAALKDAIYFVFQRPSRTKAAGSFNVDGEHDDSGGILSLFDKILDKSQEGETSSICVGAALKLLYRLEPNYDVRVHPANQAGTSSNEICDIDVLFGGTHLYGLEVKDKPYHEHDITHAADKAKESGLTKILFVRGLRATADFNDSSIAADGITIHVVDIRHFLALTLALCPPAGIGLASEVVRATAAEMRAKDQTFAWLQKILG